MPERHLDINDAIPFFGLLFLVFLILFYFLKASFPPYFTLSNNTFILASIVGSFLVLVMLYSNRNIRLILIKILAGLIYLFPFIALLILFTIISPVILSSNVPSGIPQKEVACTDINGTSENISFYFKCENPSGINYVKVGNYLSCGIGFNSNLYSNVSVRIKGNYKTPSGHISWIPGLGNQSYSEQLELDKHIPYFQTDNLNETGTYTISIELHTNDLSCTSTLFTYFDVHPISDDAIYNSNKNTSIIAILSIIATIIFGFPTYVKFIKEQLQEIR